MAHQLGRGTSSRAGSRANRRPLSSSRQCADQSSQRRPAANSFRGALAARRSMHSVFATSDSILSAADYDGDQFKMEIRTPKEVACPLGFH